MSAPKLNILIASSNRLSRDTFVMENLSYHSLLPFPKQPPGDDIRQTKNAWKAELWIEPNDSRFVAKDKTIAFCVSNSAFIQNSLDQA